MKGVGMIVGNFELDPYRRPISAWPKLFLTPKRDHVFILHSCKTMDKDVVFKYCCYKKLDFMNGVNKTKKKYTYQMYLLGVMKTGLANIL